MRGILLAALIMPLCLACACRVASKVKEEAPAVPVKTYKIETAAVCDSNKQCYIVSDSGQKIPVQYPQATPVNAAAICSAQGLCRIMLEDGHTQDVKVSFGFAMYSAAICVDKGICYILTDFKEDAANAGGSHNRYCNSEGECFSLVLPEEAPKDARASGLPARPSVIEPPAEAKKEIAAPPLPGPLAGG